VESAPRGRGPAGRPAPHAAHAHLRRPHAAHAAPGKDLLLYALLRRGSRGVAQAMALQPGDMLFPSYRQQGIYMVRGKPSSSSCASCCRTRATCARAGSCR
jgi:hypothetical protein